MKLYEWSAIKNHWDYRCCYCERKGKGKHLTKDHVIPKSKQGATKINNIIPACSHCNCLKGDQDMEEWFRSQEFFDEDRLKYIYEWQSGKCYSVVVPNMISMEVFEKGKQPKHKKQHYYNHSRKKYNYYKKAM